ncbi:MAG: PEP-CTERM sorting domain-containing protein [Deltaproteobacteria bacterium]|nr:PEP-CTERM sorting domain-containing protein [Deltaproteobacteria bacterium]
MKKFLVVVLSLTLLMIPLTVWAGAVIDNGTIQMGINDEGHLNTPFSPDPLGIGYMGLRYMPTGAASTEPGCQCEGWGAGDSLSGRSGYANVSVDGVVNLIVESFTSTASTATSVVKVVDSSGDLYRVTHAYFPSASSNLYQVDVTVENISGSATNLLYRRVMDWDIYPTPFSEFVTISHYAIGDLIRTDTNGFNSANPFSFSSFQLGPVTDAGPDDHGALFDFNFGPLGVGESKIFTTFYGAAGTETAALAALVAVGAEIYSFGQPNVPGGPDLGIPNTFIFAFKGVGAPPIGVPEPTTLILIGFGLAGIAVLRKKK